MPEQKKLGCGIILYDRALRRVLFFLRDNKPEIPCPNQLDLIGGHAENVETGEQALLRETAEELIWTISGTPYVLTGYRHYETYTDEWGTTQEIFAKEVDFDIVDITLTEGQRLEWVNISELPQTRLAFGFNRVVEQFCRENL